MFAEEIAAATSHALRVLAWRGTGARIWKEKGLTWPGQDQEIRLGELADAELTQRGDGERYS